MKEIEADGFITRESDLKNKTSRAIPTELQYVRLSDVMDALDESPVWTALDAKERVKSLATIPSQIDCMSCAYNTEWLNPECFHCEVIDGVPNHYKWEGSK